MREEAPQRGHALREVFNGLGDWVRTGCPCRLLPSDLPLWFTIHPQAMRWFRTRCFEAMAHDLRAVLRTVMERSPQPSVAIYDSRALQSTPESGPRAAYDGYKRRKGSKVHIALGHLLALKVTPANEQDRAQVGELTQAVQEATGKKVGVAFVAQGYTGSGPMAVAASHGVRLEVVKQAEAKRGFVLLPRRWVGERSFGWAACFRRLSCDYERLATTLAGAHWLAFVGLMLANLFRSSA